jgi:hypothetical protein
MPEAIRRLWKNDMTVIFLKKAFDNGRGNAGRWTQYAIRNYKSRETMTKYAGREDALRRIADARKRGKAGRGETGWENLIEPAPATTPGHDSIIRRRRLTQEVNFKAGKVAASKAVSPPAFGRLWISRLSRGSSHPSGMFPATLLFNYILTINTIFTGKVD